MTRELEPPRLAEALEQLDDATLEDDTTWQDVELRGVGVVATEKASFVEIVSARLVDVRLTGSEFEKLRVVDAVFEDCELSGVLLTEATLGRVRFERCRMSGFVARDVKGSDVQFADCRLDTTVLRGTSWEHCEWVECDLRGVDLTEATLTGVRILRSNLAGADVSRLAADEVALHGSRLESLRGADSLRGVTIGSDQAVPLSLEVFAAMGIVVDDEDDAGA